MGMAEVRERLRGVEGIQSLSMNYGPNGVQIFHINGRSIELSAMASDDQIVSAILANPFETLKVTMVKSPLRGLGQKIGLAVHNAELDAAKISAKVDELEARRSAAVPKVMDGLEAQGKDIGELETFVSDLEKAANQ